jgi:hypothetical protein
MLELDITKTCLLFAFLTTFLFILQYTFIAPWWTEPLGRTIVIKDIALLMAFSLGIMSLFFHINILTRPDVSLGIASGIYFLIGVIMVWRMTVWNRIFRSRNDRKEKTHTHQEE